MKICFIFPSSPFLINQKVFPPLGILYLASVARNYGHQVTVYDCANKTEDDWKFDLSVIQSDIYGISATTPQYKNARNIAWYLKDIRPESKIIIGGPYISCNYSPDDPDNSLFDIQVIGDGEDPLVEILSNPNARGKFTASNYTAPIDRFPYPARDLIDIHGYQYFINGIPATTMMTSRGCCYNCFFCCKWESNQKVRLHSAKYVINEIKSVQRLGYKAIMFFDDIFTINKKRLFKICDYLRSQEITFRCFVKSNLAGMDVLDYLKKSGCYEIGFGAESGSQKILDNVDKKISIEQNESLIKYCHVIGLRIKGFFIVGLPGETPETIRETERFIEKTQPDDIDFTVLSVFKGSDIYRNPQKYDIQFDDSQDFYKGTPGRYQAHIRTAELEPEELLGIRDRLELKYKSKEYLR